MCECLEIDLLWLKNSLKRNRLIFRPTENERLKAVLHKLRKASRLSLAEWSFFLQAWFWLLFFDLGLRTRSFPDLQAFAARPSSRRATPSESREDIIHVLSTAVDRARYNHLYPMTCLRRALTLQKLLAQRGIPVELKIGVRKEDGLLLAHAWIQYQGKIVGEPERITETYSALQKI